MVINPNPFHCYSVRRLNPFLGVVQVMAADDSRALSLDGKNWEIQIRAELPGDTWGGISMAPPSVRFLRFGVWSPSQGLRKVPANPLLDLTKMIPMADDLILALEERYNQIPFVLADRFEYWLLEARNRYPLALLSSAIDESQLVVPTSPSWIASHSGTQDFSLAKTKPQKPAHPRGADQHQNMSAVERLVRIRNGDAGACWIERDASGIGKTLDVNVDKRSAIPLSTIDADLFPPLLLQSKWEEPQHQTLISAYLDWLSPYLLTLQHLRDDIRGNLEVAAQRRATLVNNIWRLYPRVVDHGTIDRARVEARIRGH